MKLHVWPTEPHRIDDSVVVSATLEVPGQKSDELWYRVPIELSDAVTGCGDVFVAALVMIAMRRPADLYFHGAVSPSLLDGLTDFQAVWNAWRPDEYEIVEVAADSLRESGGHSGSALLAFSGGLDSSFTLHRHTQGNAGWQTKELGACVMAHGFDIPLDDEEGFAKAHSRARAITESVGVPVIPVATNWREFCDRWLEQHGAAIVSCLHLLGADRRYGLVAGTYGYQNFARIGSNPLSDPLLSSGLAIRHDGAFYSRLQKVEAIANWPEARRYLRVCWEGARRYTNCCKCAKCVLTILGFRVQGAGLPECFEQDVTDGEIKTLRIKTAAQFDFLREVMDRADAGGHSRERWAVALRQRLRQAQSRAALKRTLRTLRSISIWKRRRQSVATQGRYDERAFPS